MFTLATLIACPLVAVAHVAHAEPDPGAAWVKANAIPLRTSEAGNGFDDLKGLDAIIGDARIVALGEPTHGTREAFQLKHRLLEYLVENKGFTIFSIEANMPESYALNDYVVHGKGDPEKLIAGMYFWTWRTEEVLAMVQWMRAWNERNPPSTGKPRLEFTGFDMQTPDVAWSIANSYIAAHAPDLAQASAPLLSRVKAAAQSAQGGRGADWTSATGTFPVNAARGKKLRFSCWIRTEGVTGWAGAWWRCDTPDGVNGFNNMQDQKITGDTEWKRYEFTIDVPADAQATSFGFLLSGPGTAWFDDIEITLDGVKYEDAKAFTFDFENDAVRYLAGGSPAYAVARSKTKPHGGTTCLEIRRRAENEVPKVSPGEVQFEAESLVAELLHRRDELAKKTSERDADWAIQNARVVAQAAAMFAAENGFNARDEAMAANVRWILDQNPGRKIVIWAHNGHVSKAGYAGLKSMGAHLRETHSPQMVVFGFATGAGTYTASESMAGSLKHDNVLKEPPAASVERVFLDSGLPLAIVNLGRANKDDPGTAWAATNRLMRSIGALATDTQFYPCIASDMYDVLVWQKDTTASRPLK